jgi:putative two-component system response regulator
MTFTAPETSVLIVEDHADTAEMLRRYLARKGYTAEVAPNGVAALSSVARRRPTCVILDETMPGMTGLAVLREMQATPEVRDIPVFFYSAAFDRRKQQEAEALGARGWYVKGISRLTDLMDNVIATARRAG